MIFYSPYIRAEMLRSYKWIGYGMGWVWDGSLCGAIVWAPLCGANKHNADSVRSPALPFGLFPKKKNTFHGSFNSMWLLVRRSPQDASLWPRWQISPSLVSNSSFYCSSSIDIFVKTGGMCDCGVVLPDGVSCRWGLEERFRELWTLTVWAEGGQAVWLMTTAT